MKAIDIFRNFYSESLGVFSIEFVQTFVERNGTLNMREFIRFFELTASYAEINNALVEVNGSKRIPFDDFVPTPADWKIAVSRYKYGKYSHVRDLIMELGAEGIYVSRDLLFRHVAAQRPERNANSFLPTSMQDTGYERRETRSAGKEPVQETAE